MNQILGHLSLLLFGKPLFSLFSFAHWGKTGEILAKPNEPRETWEENPLKTLQVSFIIQLHKLKVCINTNKGWALVCLFIICEEGICSVNEFVHKIYWRGNSLAC